MQSQVVFLYTLWACGTGLWSWVHPFLRSAKIFHLVHRTSDVQFLGAACGGEGGCCGPAESCWLWPPTECPLPYGPLSSPYVLWVAHPRYRHQRWQRQHCTYAAALLMCQERGYNARSSAAAKKVCGSESQTSWTESQNLKCICWGMLSHHRDILVN